MPTETTPATTAERREQIAKQHDAVAHMAKTLADLATDYASIIRHGHGVLEIAGPRSAAEGDADA